MSNENLKLQNKKKRDFLNKKKKSIKRLTAISEYLQLLPQDNKAKSQFFRAHYDLLYSLLLDSFSGYPDSTLDRKGKKKIPKLIDYNLFFSLLEQLFEFCIPKIVSKWQYKSFSNLFESLCSLRNNPTIRSVGISTLLKYIDLLCDNCTNIILQVLRSSICFDTFSSGFNTEHIFFQTQPNIYELEGLKIKDTTPFDSGERIRIFSLLLDFISNKTKNYNFWFETFKESFLTTLYPIVSERLGLLSKNSGTGFREYCPYPIQKSIIISILKWLNDDNFTDVIYKNPINMELILEIFHQTLFLPVEYDHLIISVLDQFKLWFIKQYETNLFLPNKTDLENDLKYIPFEITSEWPEFLATYFWKELFYLYDFENINEETKMHSQRISIYLQMFNYLNEIESLIPRNEKTRKLPYLKLFSPIFEKGCFRNQKDLKERSLSFGSLCYLYCINKKMINFENISKFYNILIYGLLLEDPNITKSILYFSSEIFGLSFPGINGLIIPFLDAIDFLFSLSPEIKINNQIAIQTTFFLSTIIQINENNYKLPIFNYNNILNKKNRDKIIMEKIQTIIKTKENNLNNFNINKENNLNLINNLIKEKIFANNDNQKLNYKKNKMIQKRKNKKYRKNRKNKKKNITTTTTTNNNENSNNNNNNENNNNNNKNKKIKADINQNKEQVINKELNYCKEINSNLFQKIVYKEKIIKILNNILQKSNNSLQKSKNFC
ncbi:anillin/rhotekin rtkn [Anaeramoeba flamelloides]|uniref:Anillin/rhotekin rtkn n=1 Tax=Anaeramoeba flamelloides TaxID=1746091 RepID=A0AAV7ZBR2_9EUKA|nr:anillin/rhotekin rtkn [Anaeramoeba flamelloides]